MVVPSKWSGDFLGLDYGHFVRDAVALDYTYRVAKEFVAVFHRDILDINGVGAAVSELVLVNVDAVVLDVAQVEGVVGHFVNQLGCHTWGGTPLKNDDDNDNDDEWKFFHTNSFLMVNTTWLPRSIDLRILW